MLAVFDGHNDALTRDDADRFAAGRDGGHLDLPRARAGGLAGGVFAIFTPSAGEEVIRERPGGWEAEPRPPVAHETAAAHATGVMGRMLGLEREGHLRLARAPGDLESAREAGVLAAVAHLEGAEAIRPRTRSSSGTRPAYAPWDRCGAAPTLSATGCRSRSRPRRTPGPG